MIKSVRCVFLAADSMKQIVFLFVFFSSTAFLCASRSLSAERNVFFFSNSQWCSQHTKNVDCVYSVYAISSSESDSREDTNKTVLRMFGQHSFTAFERCRIVTNDEFVDISVWRTHHMFSRVKMAGVFVCRKRTELFNVKRIKE